MTLGNDSISNKTCASIRIRLSKTISFWGQFVRLLKWYTRVREAPRPRPGQQHCSRQGKVSASEAAGLWPSVRFITWDETSQGLSGMEVPVNSHVPAPVNLLNIYLHGFVISWQPNTILPCPAHSTSKHWTLTQSVIWDRTSISIFVVFQCTLMHPNWYTDTGTQGKHYSSPPFTHLLY